jgi:hypothetical protein
MKGSDIFRIMSVGVRSKDTPAASSSSCTIPYASDALTASKRGDASTNRQSSCSGEQSHMATLTCRLERSKAWRSSWLVLNSRATNADLSRSLLHVFGRRPLPQVPVLFPTGTSGSGFAPTIAGPHSNGCEKRDLFPLFRTCRFQTSRPASKLHSNRRLSIVSWRPRVSCE